MKLRKLIAFLCAAAIGTTAAPYIVSETISGGMASALAAENVMTITKQGGGFECAYAEWQSSAQTSGYTVTYKVAGASEEITVDKQLVRRYSDHYRVDIPGLKAGDYTITIKDGSDGTVTTNNISVSAHTREGFAFSEASPNGGNASGGYNADGTVPADAKILYITQDNVNTVSMTIGKKTYTGLGNILNGISNASSPDRPSGHYIIRILGTLNGDSISFEDGNSDSNRQLFYLQEISNLTVEGIGDDATLYRCSFLVKGSANVEVRNLGIMLYLDDGLAIENSNSNIWIHNNDIFYGSPGTDSDQVKGDGALDIKGDSTYCTLSYNHFWDNGKSSLVISSGKNVDDTTSNLSYHHNWFDHSDSRHPRIRFATVHMYNNYFDGNAKYGTGVTSGASAFVEANYFRACKHPMMSSMQGSDTGGTFSKEAGGIIKAYNNTMVNCGETIYYSSDSDFDAYLANTRDEQVPSTVVTKQNTYSGLSGHTYNDKYNNFDTASTMYTYTPDSPEDVPAKVTANAGRLNGGDFEWSFSGSDADENADVDSALKTALTNYKPTVVQLYSGAAGELYPATDGSTPTITAAPATATPKPTTAPTASPSATGNPANPTEAPTPTAPSEQPDKKPYIVELTAENGIITAAVQSETAEEINACGFIAQYDADGRLVGIKSMTWNGGNSTLTADAVQGAVSARGFVWNVSYEPISEVKKADIE